MSQQEPIADQLILIIRKIQSGRNSGTLTVQRGTGVTLERGSITFVKGQITQAKTDRRTGSEALNVLSTWRKCFYRFTPLSPSSNAMQSVETAGQFFPEQSKSSASSPYIKGEDIHIEASTPAPAGSISNAPYRTRQMDDAMQILKYRGLSRTHRHLFLLIDGRRSITELAQLLKHERYEVDKLLHDLEDAALIRLSEAMPDHEEQ